MTFTPARGDWLNPNSVAPTIVMFGALFAMTWILDYSFDRMGINPSSTLFDNFAIAYVGAAIILYYQIKAYRRYRSARAEDKADLYEEVRHYIHQELTAIDKSADLENREERVRRIEEATHRITTFLVDFERVAKAPTIQPRPSANR